MNGLPKILVGTLYCGEEQFDRCVSSLQAQDYRNWHQKILSFLPNKVAHDTLYAYFMQHAEEFDLFLKLDADMVFLRQSGLSEIVAIFAANPELSHLQAVVNDWLTDSLIMGFQVFRSHVKWSESKENLFVDRKPMLNGIRWDLWQEPAPFVSHNAEPSKFQAFHFGVHRALKAIQPFRLVFRENQFYAQTDMLKKIWNNFLASNDTRQGHAALGAYLVFRGKIQRHLYDYTNPDLKRRYQRDYESLEGSELTDLMKNFWSRDFNMYKPVRTKFMLSGWIKKCLSMAKRISR